MTTPHQGPGMWQQGNAFEALEWLANLDGRQQQALQRAMNTHQALGPIYNAVARVHQVSVQTAQRLSEGAQSLASQTAQFGRNTAARADLAAQRTGEAARGAGRAVVHGAQATGQAIATGAQATGRAVTTGAQATGRAVTTGAQATGRAVATGAQATGQAVATGAQATGQAVGTAGRAVADAGRQAAGKVSRWFQGGRSKATDLANATRAGFAAFRHDMGLAQVDMKDKDIQSLTARAHALVSAQTPEARSAAAQQLLQAASSLESPHAQQTGGRHRAAEANLVNKFANEGLAPASSIPGQQAPQGGTAAGPQQGAQGEAQRTGGQPQGQKGPDLTK